MTEAHYTLSIEGNVIALVDLGTGVSVTNTTAEVIAELALMIPNLNGYRVIYRDAMQNWDGLAQRDGRFIGFVPLATTDRQTAVDLARRGVDCNGRPWRGGS